MKIYKTTYRIYDDFGELLKIVVDRPTDKSYTFTVEKEVVCRKESARFDTDSFEEALF